MAARRGRPAKGDRRFDACIDRFAAMGYAARNVRAVVQDLLKVYGGPSPDVWRVLEAGSYEVVQERLFEIEEEEKQKQDQQPLLEYHQQQGGQQVGDEPPQLLEIEEEKRQEEDAQLLYHQQQDGQQVEDEPPQGH